MNCREAHELMHGYLDGDLDDSSLTRLKDHLRECSACRAYLEQLERAESVVRALPKTRVAEDLEQRIIECLPKRSRRRRFVSWIKRHPAITAASVFLFVMLGSFLTMWGQDGELVVKGANLDQLVIHGKEVYVPEGTVVNGNLLVQDGKIEVAGEVKGDLIVIHGSYALASTAKVAGQVKQVDQAIEWLWYKFGELAAIITPE